MVLLEICVDSITSAVNASEAGADRIELCSALSEGGLTPSAGLFLGVKKAIGSSKTKIFCMIRIRRGDFRYSDDEVEAMIEDVKYFKLHGADGIVFGSLDRENEIHHQQCRRIVAAWGKQKPITFHRAFDETNKEDMEENIIILKDLGFNRILSSGYEPSAERGIQNLKRLVDHTRNTGLKIIPGAGITKKNVASIITETGCEEIHASARSESKDSIASRLSMGGGPEDLNPLMICDVKKVQELIALSKALL